MINHPCQDFRLFSGCLSTIAVRAYGDGYRWPEIAQANDLEDPDIIHVGDSLTIPR